MYTNSQYNTICLIILFASIIQAVFSIFIMIDYIPISEAAWIAVSSVEIVLLLVCIINYDPRYPPKSLSHNIYRMYVLSVIGIVLTVLVFMIFAVFRLVVAQVAVMTYLFFCLPLWLNLFVSFSELQKTYPKVISSNQ